MTVNQLKQFITRLFIFKEPPPKEDFILHGAVGIRSIVPQRREEEKGKKKKRLKKKPLPIARASSPAKGGAATDDPGEADPEGQDGQNGKNRPDRPYTDMLVSPELEVNKERIKQIYSLPKNKDIILREFVIQLDRPVKAFAAYIEGISDRGTINENILRPLMSVCKPEMQSGSVNLAEYLKDSVIYGNQVDLHEKYKDIIPLVNYGCTVLFIDSAPAALVVETKGWDHRSIGKPETEQVIRGPHEAFNETLRSNTGLLRKAIRNTDLITEFIKIGTRNQTDVALMYLENVANPKLVAEVKRRISSISTDYVGETGILEQFIEDHPLMPLPQVLATERPDRTASFIMDGKVAILLDGNPNVLIVPADLFSLLHSPEDYYLRLPYGNLVRLMRVIAVFISLITPAFYVSIAIFHQEMIPTDLILAIAAGRETVPFPTIVEVFFMEFAFEMIREAGVRVPGVIGNTLGIVGALILGQAAVQAGIVSPILIIVVALTGLASFAIPNYSMSFAFRGVRFVFTALAAAFGFPGITAGLFVLLSGITAMKSFGVPFMVPIGPRTRSGPDIVMRGPVWSMEERPDFLDTQERRRQPQISRGWVKKKAQEPNGGGRNQ
ncbi:MAG: spore germination protein [Clostridia bacterium]|jgi:spore germination protein KA|nr:spore germination protein [Clostridia bacterium]